MRDLLVFLGAIAAFGLAFLDQWTTPRPPALPMPPETWVDLPREIFYPGDYFMRGPRD